MKKHANIPIFIPHLGCPNSCVFCDQRTISGSEEFDISSVERIINDSLESLKNTDCESEIAFFGGSFTGIDRALMTQLLDMAQSYVKRGVCGIRMSTRPDYINAEIADLLKHYTVSAVELGIQTMSDRVLKASKRGHLAENTRQAVRILRENGFSVVGQMMIGLPTSTPEDELDCAREICALGCEAARIYPTLVLRGTCLEQMMKQDKYIPITVEEAVSRSADVLAIFEENGVECLRIGLCDSELLHSSEHCAAGPVHPAMGELVRGELWRRRIVKQLCERGERSALTEICVPIGALSAVVGQKRINRTEYERICNGKVVIKESAALVGSEFEILSKTNGKAGKACT